MRDKSAPGSTARASTSAPPPAQLGVCLVGGKKILRKAIELLLASHQIRVCGSFADEDSLEKLTASGQIASGDVLLLILSGVGPFGTFRRIHETLTTTGHAVPLVVLSEQASRGQIYAALRIGAKAYVNLDAEPEEFIQAIRMASQDKVYLAPDATELLVNDLSTAVVPLRRPRLPQTELSRREAEVVQMLCEGLSSKEIAHHLHLSAKTVENHRYNIYRKCEVDSIASLMRYAIQQGLVTI